MKGITTHHPKKSKKRNCNIQAVVNRHHIIIDQQCENNDIKLYPTIHLLPLVFVRERQKSKLLHILYVVLSYHLTKRSAHHY